MDVIGAFHELASDIIDIICWIKSELLHFIHWQDKSI